MTIGNGWTASAHEVTRIHLLDWVADNRDILAERFVASGPFFDVDEDTAEALIASLVADGLLQDGDRLGDGSVLSPAGVTDVAERRERRADPIRRRAAMRDAVLNFIAQHDGGSAVGIPDLLRSPHSFYEGEHATEHELHGTHVFLINAGLADSAAGWGDLGGLTPQGWEVVEDFGSIAAYRAGQRSAAGTTITTNFYGPIEGLVGIGGGDVVQSTGQDMQEILDLLHAVREAASSFPADQRALVATWADVVQAEAATDDDTARQTALARLKQIGTKTAAVTYQAAVAALAARLMGSA